GFPVHIHTWDRLGEQYIHNTIRFWPTLVGEKCLYRIYYNKRQTGSYSQPTHLAYGHIWVSLRRWCLCCNLGKSPSLTTMVYRRGLEHKGFILSEHTLILTCVQMYNLEPVCMVYRHRHRAS